MVRLLALSAVEPRDEKEAAGIGVATKGVGPATLTHNNHRTVPNKRRPLNSDCDGRTVTAAVGAAVVGVTAERSGRALG